MTAEELKALGEAAAWVPPAAAFAYASTGLYRVMHGGSFIGWRMAGWWRKLTCYAPGWRNTMTGCGLRLVIAQKPDKFPKRKRVKVTHWCDRVLVKPIRGQGDIERYRRVSGDLAAAFNKRLCYVTPHETRYDRLWLDFPTGRVLRNVIDPLPIPVSADLEAVQVGIFEDGSPWTVRLLYNHLLVGGRPGSGKSSVVWSIIRALANDIKHGRVDIYAVDPKGGQEFNRATRRAPDGREVSLFFRYADEDTESMLQVLRDAVAAMEDRARDIRDETRKLEPSFEHPLILVIVDEFADLLNAEDSGVKKEARQLCEKLLRKGRSNGVHLLLAGQDCRKETVPFRSLLGDGIALALRERLEVDMVLGGGAFEQGARCTDLRTKTEAGFAFVEHEDRIRLARAAYLDDGVIERMVWEYGRVREPEPEPSESADDAQRA